MNADLTAAHNSLEKGLASEKARFAKDLQGRDEKHAAAAKAAAEEKRELSAAKEELATKLGHVQHKLDLATKDAIIALYSTPGGGGSGVGSRL